MDLGVELCRRRNNAGIEHVVPSTGAPITPRLWPGASHLLSADLFLAAAPGRSFAVRPNSLLVCDLVFTEAQRSRRCSIVGVCPSTYIVR